MRARWRASPLGRLPARHVAWAIAKLIAIVWMLSYVFTAPPQTFAILGWFLWALLPIAAAAGVVSIVGMVISHSPTPGAPRRGLTIELSGLWVMLSGPFAHAVTMFVIMVGGEGTTRFGPMMQSVFMLAVISVRIVEVRRPWSRITGAA